MAPKWIPDEYVTICKCGSKFGVIKRKHHCRGCGDIFCGDCLTKKAKLKYANNKFDKVCDACYDILKEKGINNQN